MLPYGEGYMTEQSYILVMVESMESSWVMTPRLFLWKMTLQAERISDRTNILRHYPSETSESKK